MSTEKIKNMENSATEDNPSQQVELPSSVSVKSLASIMNVDPVDVIKQLMRNGYMLTINDAVDPDIATLICQAYGLEVKEIAGDTSEPKSLVPKHDESDLQYLESRPPVVTILGHVDHGKTTLLDYIRDSSVVTGEAGGITQHIGAYQVESGGNLITFLDTPGHEAFTAMRARGAQVTDVAVLVVAADDGVMPQTVEAINHVKAAGVPIITAINKVDKADADLERVKRELAEHDVLIEEWGGDAIAVPVSALTGEGVADLLANIQLVSEIGELKANPTKPAQGIIVEARIDKNRGPTATVLVQAGELTVGCIIAAGVTKGRVKAMIDSNGNNVDAAGPSVPVEILGLNGIPEAGESFIAASNDKEARGIVETELKKRSARGGPGVTLEEIYSRIESGETKSLALIVKTDVQGSIDAVRNALDGIQDDQSTINIIHAASGQISESDVLLAVASEAVIVGFNTDPSPGALSVSKQEHIDVRTYKVIYDLVDDISNALKGLLDPVIEDVLQGYATVRTVFNLKNNIRIAGVYVNEGIISRRAEMRVTRNSKVVFSGPVASLKHFKDDVREINTGLEGGLVIDGFNDFNEGDIIEAHLESEVE